MTKHSLAARRTSSRSPAARARGGRRPAGEADPVIVSSWLLSLKATGHGHSGPAFAFSHHHRLPAAAAVAAVWPLSAARASRVCMPSFSPEGGTSHYTPGFGLFYRRRKGGGGTSDRCCRVCVCNTNTRLIWLNGISTSDICRGHFHSGRFLPAGSKLSIIE